MESRAAVFTSQPQAVEVYQAGAWRAGELLGWRHDANGTCQVWVRTVLAGIEQTVWTELSDLRLPERHLTVASEPSAGAEPSPVVDASITQMLPRASSAPECSGESDAAATASMPAVRDLSVVGGGASRRGGRRRAPEGPETTVATVAAAVAALAEPRPGGRRRAPEGSETVVAAALFSPRPGGRRRAPEGPAGVELTEVVACAPVAPGAGRHRAVAPVDPGRHRKADTGVVPIVTDVAPAAPAPSAPPVPSPQPEDTFGGRTRSAWSAVGEPQPELLTRPMRLSDRIPTPRRPRLDGSLTGV
jgi:hypothetical protein